jgi:hypothetical protein
VFEAEYNQCLLARPLGDEEGSSFGGSDRRTGPMRHYCTAYRKLFFESNKAINRSIKIIFDIQTNASACGDSRVPGPRGVIMVYIP